MRVYDFCKMIDLEEIDTNELTVIIPIIGNDTVNMGESKIDESKKIHFDSSEFVIEDADLYDTYNIKVKIKNYDTVEIFYSEDNYRYIVDTKGQFYVVLI